MDWGKILGGAIKQGFEKAPSVARQAAKSFQDMRTDMPTNMATAGRYVRSAIAPKFNVPSYNDIMHQNKMYEEAYGQMSPKEQLNYDFKNEGIHMESFADKSGSAELRPMSVYPNDPNLNAVKEETFKRMKLRPAMERYLRTIPVQQADLSKAGAGGMATMGIHQMSNPGGTWETNQNVTPEPNILLDQQYPISPGDGPAERILQHEYMHSTPRTAMVQLGMKKLLDVLPKKLRGAALQYYGDGRLPPNPEELFATLGEQYGEYALTIPEISAYYRDIYMQPKEKDNPVEYIDEPWTLPMKNGGYATPVDKKKLTVPIKIMKRK